MIVILLISFIFVLCYLFLRSYNYWRSRGVPFDKPFFIFGSLYDVIVKNEHFFHRIRHIYNECRTPYVGIYIFNQPHLLVRSLELIKKILVKDFDKFANRNFSLNESVDPIIFHALFSAKGSTWKNLRSKTTPIFSSGKIKLMMPLMKECVENLVEYLKHNGDVIDVTMVSKKYSVDIISSCVFGLNSNCLNNDDSEILKMAKQLTDPESFVRNVSIFSYLLAPKLVDIFRLTFMDKTASDYLASVFKATAKEREERHIVRNDLVDLLTNLKKETLNENYRFDDIKIISQALAFFQAGNETTSLTLAYVFYELALNKDVQDRLRNEIRDLFPRESDLSYEALQGMKYLDMVFNETLRKYPLTVFLSRRSTASYVFEETDFTLDKDVSVIIPTAALHYDPEYFPDPEKFDPDRFSEKNKTNIRPYTFMPFGEGPRNCIGQRFGTLVAKIAIVNVVKDFVLETDSLTEIPLKYNSTSLFLQNKAGVHLKVIKI